VKLFPVCDVIIAWSRISAIMLATNRRRILRQSTTWKRCQLTSNRPLTENRASRIDLWHHFRSTMPPSGVYTKLREMQNSEISAFNTLQIWSQLSERSRVFSNTVELPVIRWSRELQFHRRVTNLSRDAQAKYSTETYDVRNRITSLRPIVSWLIVRQFSPTHTTALRDSSVSTKYRF
jgi:hypothetical protein